MELAVIESPFKTIAFDVGEQLVLLDEARNVEYARALARHCLTTLGLAPWASHLLYPQPGILRDDDPDERNLGIQAGLLWSSWAGVCVVGLDRGVTEGMRRFGIPHAVESGQPLVEVRLGGAWEVPPLAGLSLDELSNLSVVPPACLPMRNKPCVAY